MSELDMIALVPARNRRGSSDSSLELLDRSPSPPADFNPQYRKTPLSPMSLSTRSDSSKRMKILKKEHQNGDEDVFLDSIVNIPAPGNMLSKSYADWEKKWKGRHDKYEHLNESLLTEEGTYPISMIRELGLLKFVGLNKNSDSRAESPPCVFFVAENKHSGNPGEFTKLTILGAHTDLESAIEHVLRYFQSAIRVTKAVYDLRRDSSSFIRGIGNIKKSSPDPYQWDITDDGFLKLRLHVVGGWYDIHILEKAQDSIIYTMKK